MPANHHIDSKSRLIITTWEGVAQDIEFIVAIKKYQRDIQSNPNYIGYNEIVDLSKAASFKFTTKGIKTIGRIASETDQKDVNRKLSIIVNSTYAYGLARMYEAYRSFSKKSNKEIRVFKDKKEAFEWVQK